MLSRSGLSGRATGRTRGLTAALAMLAVVCGGGAATAQIAERAAPTITSIEIAHNDQLVAYTLAPDPDILVFDFPTLEQQGLMFNRVVAMVERQGAPRERVLTDRELAELIRSAGKRTATFAFGNDFRVSELVKFFNLAEEGQVVLNAEELRLRAFIESKGYMKTKFGFFNYLPPDKVILSLPQEEGRDGPDHVTITHTTRNAILRHEVSHGEFYANDDYELYCEQFWGQVMSDAERKAFRAFLAAKNYDPDNEELMINETQAYLIHTPDPNVFNAAKVKLPEPAVEALRVRFWAGNPPSQLFRNERQRGT